MRNSGSKQLLGVRAYGAALKWLVKVTIRVECMGVECMGVGCVGWRAGLVGLGASVVNLGE